MPVTTTLRKLRKEKACADRYKILLRALGPNYGDTKPIDLVRILETNGLNDVLLIPENALSGNHIKMRYRLFAVACCQDILHLMDDPRSRDAVRIAHLYAYGEATDDDLSAARDAADRAYCSIFYYAPARVAARAAIEAIDFPQHPTHVHSMACHAAAWTALNTSWTANSVKTWNAARAAVVAARAKRSEHFRLIFSANFDD